MQAHAYIRRWCGAEVYFQVQLQVFSGFQTFPDRQKPLRIKLASRTRLWRFNAQFNNQEIYLRGLLLWQNTWHPWPTCAMQTQILYTTDTSYAWLTLSVYICLHFRLFLSSMSGNIYATLQNQYKIDDIFTTSTEHHQGKTRCKIGNQTV